MAREEGESGREHAARIIQKLDLHRKATFGAGIEASQVNASGSAGIASMISSNHSFLPGYPHNTSNSGISRQTSNMLPSVDTHPSTLAPLTLVKPPAATGLSRTAVLTAGEWANNKKLPPSVVANYWGSSVWGTVNIPIPPILPRLDDDDPIGIVVSESSQTSLGKIVQQKQFSDTFPSNYPPELKAQHAQFRLLFPNVPSEEKLVLVFGAAWTSSSDKDPQRQAMAGDGRIYITPDNMYFYGQQIGLVTAYSISLDNINEVTAASGKDCDYIFLHLRQDGSEDAYSRITIKVFLEDLGLLHTRLNLLIDDLQAEEPMELDAIISTLTNLEREEYERHSPSAESWEEVSANTPIDEIGRAHV